MSKREKYLSAKAAGWCKASVLYAERFLPAHINTIKEGEEWVSNDELLLERLNTISDEIGEPRIFRTREQALKIMRSKRMNAALTNVAGDWEATNEWRWTDVSGASLFTGSLDELQNIPTVDYDDNKWWFARGIDGSLLNNAEEVEAYNASLIRERKYYDASDDLVTWKPE